MFFLWIFGGKKAGGLNPKVIGPFNRILGELERKKFQRVPKIVTLKKYSKSSHVTSYLSHVMRHMSPNLSERYGINGPYLFY